MQNHSDPDEPKVRWRLPRLIFISVMLAFLVCILDSLTGGVLFGLLFGWSSFAATVLPAITVRWDSVAVFAVGFAIATLSLHVLVKWLTKERNKRQGKSNVPGEPNDELKKVRWSFRSSIAAMSMILFVFVVGISMTGVVHQTGWLLTGPESIAIGIEQTEQDSRLSRYDPTRQIGGDSWIWTIGVYLHEVPAKESPNEPFNSESNASQFRKKFMPTVLCPSQKFPGLSRDGFPLSHVVANPAALGKKLEVLNGSSLLAGEINAGFDPWAAPLNTRSPDLGIRNSWNGTPPDQVGYGSQHPGGVNIVKIDGSVQFLSAEVSPEVLRQLSDPLKGLKESFAR